MAWIESHQSLGNHPKLLRLSAQLRINRAQAVGHLQYLWWWALDYSSGGDLSAFAATEISAASHWPTDPEPYLQALKECGWIDKDGHLHDWEDYAGRLIERKDKQRSDARERQRRFREDVTRYKRVSNADEKNSNATTVPDLTVPDLTKPNTFADAPPPTPPKPKKEPKEQKKTSPDYQPFVDHVCSTYKQKYGFAYMWGGEDGKKTNELLANYDRFQLMALWDIFLAGNWNWVNARGDAVSVSHSLREFFGKVRILLEENKWKPGAERYTREIGTPPSIIGDIMHGLPRIPPATNHQAAILAAEKLAQTL